MVYAFFGIDTKHNVLHKNNFLAWPAWPVQCAGVVCGLQDISFHGGWRKTPKAAKEGGVGLNSITNLFAFETKTLKSLKPRRKENEYGCWDTVHETQVPHDCQSESASE